MRYEIRFTNNGLWGSRKWQQGLSIGKWQKCRYNAAYGIDEIHLLAGQGLWLGYLQDYPDYWTQGQSLEDLQSHLRDLYQDLTSGEIPGVRKLAELSLR